MELEQIIAMIKNPDDRAEFERLADDVDDDRALDRMVELMTIAFRAVRHPMPDRDQLRAMASAQDTGQEGDERDEGD